MASWLRLPVLFSSWTPRFSRQFSWKSRLNRDPDLRQRKQEALNKRYTLRRLGELEEDVKGSEPHGTLITRFRDQVDAKLSTASSRISKFSNIEFIDKADLHGAKVGETIPLADLVASISTPNPRCAVIVVKDRGNTERVLKALKRELPHLQVSIMDRERIEVRLPKATAELREDRGRVIDGIAQQAKKDLKKLELQTYDVIKKQSITKAEMLAIRDQVEKEFSSASKKLDAAVDEATEALGLEPTR